VAKPVRLMLRFVPVPTHASALVTVWLLHTSLHVRTAKLNPYCRQVVARVRRLLPKQ
jgi:type IV secretory pathway TrbD component